MSARIIRMAQWRADRERAAIHDYMRGDYHRRPVRPTLNEIMAAGPHAGRWS